MKDGQPTTHLYFAYGANTNLDSMADRCPQAVSLGAATLQDWQFRFARHADVVRCPGDWVDGVLWEITDECLSNLDNFEGYPHYYIRETVQVEHNARTVDALVYTMVTGQADSPPSDGYLNILAQGYVDHGVSIRQICDAYANSHGWLPVVK